MHLAVRADQTPTETEKAALERLAASPEVHVVHKIFGKVGSTAGEGWGKRGEQKIKASITKALHPYKIPQFPSSFAVAPEKKIRCHFAHKPFFW